MSRTSRVPQVSPLLRDLGDSLAAANAALHHELTTKRRGELAELAFTLKAASLGFGVSKPYGDSERYDFILDSRDLHPHLTPSPKCQRAQVTPAIINHFQICHPERSQPVSNANRLAKSKDPYRSNRPQPDRRHHPRRQSDHPTTADHAAPPLFRVQVKCSTQLIDGLYRVNAGRHVHGRAVPYAPSEIDFFVAYIIPEDSWFILPIHAVAGRTSLLFRRLRDPKPGLYDHYREAWHLVRRI